MKNYSMACSCGQVMKVDGMTRDEAVAKLKSIMNQEGIDAHWSQFHKDDKNPKPPMVQVHAMVDQMLTEVAPM